MYEVHLYRKFCGRPSTLECSFFVWMNENLKFQYTLRGLDPTYWLAVGLSQKLINNFSMVIIKLFFSSLNCWGAALKNAVNEMVFLGVGHPSKLRGEYHIHMGCLQAGLSWMNKLFDKSFSFVTSANVTGTCTDGHIVRHRVTIGILPMENLRGYEQMYEQKWPWLTWSSNKQKMDHCHNGNVR